MFSDSPVESAGFTVTAEEAKKEDEASCQTEPQSSNEQDTQTALSRDFSSQTHTLQPQEPPEYDAERLANFLNKIYPDLIEELNKNEWPCKLNNCDLAYDEQVTNLHNIESEKLQGRVVSCLSWNSTGMSLAISFCEPFHGSWCTHSGQVYIYNTNRNELSHLPPDHILKTDSCPKCISFHPIKPSLLVAGLYNGQMIVWDLKEDDVFPVGSGPNQQFLSHSDVITCITWVFDGDYFVTSGKDGMVIFWKIFMKEIEPYKRFFISSEYCSPGRSAINGHAEIFSLGFWKDPKELDFIIATGGGNIFHCSSESKENIPFKPGFSDPVLMQYESHSGIITCITCSSSDIFATSGTDSEIHVYSSREKVPIHIVHSEFPLFGVEWIDHIPDIVICWGSSPNVHFYKTTSKEKLDAYTIKLGNPDAEILATKLNKQRRGVVAVGTNKGEISIWMVPHISSP